jgi:hypothetical protein
MKNENMAMKESMCGGRSPDYIPELIPIVINFDNQPP